jgi:hypothetical protein
MGAIPLRYIQYKPWFLARVKKRFAIKSPLFSPVHGQIIPFIAKNPSNSYHFQRKPLPNTTVCAILSVGKAAVIK